MELSIPPFSVDHTRANERQENQIAKTPVNRQNQQTLRLVFIFSPTTARSKTYYDRTATDARMSKSFHERAKKIVSAKKHTAEGHYIISNMKNQYFFAKYDHFFANYTTENKTKNQFIK